MEASKLTINNSVTERLNHKLFGKQTNFEFQKIIIYWWYVTVSFRKNGPFELSEAKKKENYLRSELCAG